MEALETFGRKSGLAFQIKDDVLDLMATPEETGKPQGSDLLEGKRTLIVIRAYEEGGEETRELLERVIERGEAETAPELVEALRDEGHIAYAEERASRLMEEAKESLNHLPESGAREDLWELAGYMVDRGC